jgi:hypothetical protein
MPSDFVRQELRAAVCARTQHQQLQQQQGLQQQGMVPSPRQQPMVSVGPSGSNVVSAADLEALGLTFEMASSAGKLISKSNTNNNLVPQQTLRKDRK